MDHIAPSNQRRSNRQAENDIRNEFCRDHDRILYSEEFRRLEGVTQVATGGTARVHNRLTHSLRVAQLARTIANRLNSLRENEKPGAPTEKIDEYVVGAAGLAHDLGHPPYGHNGEQQLQAILVCPQHQNTVPEARRQNRQFCKDCYLQDSFEGNAQTFHMLSLLAEKRNNTVSINIDSNDKDKKRVDDCYNPEQQGVISLGLDLTRATLASVIKYPWLRGEKVNGNADSKRKTLFKWNIYDCDMFSFEWVCEGKRSCLPTLSAQIMDMADDIAYAVHDIEDFYRTRIIPLNLIGDWNSNEFRNLINYFYDERNADVIPKVLSDFTNEYKNMKDEMIKNGKSDVIEYCDKNPERFKYVRAILRLLVTFKKLLPYDGSSDAIQRLSDFRSSLIGELINHIVYDLATTKLRFDSEEYILWIEFLKQLTWYYVIDNPHHFALVIGQREKIRIVFHELYDYALSVWVNFGGDIHHSGNSEKWTLRENDFKFSRRIPPLFISFYRKNKGVFDSNQAFYNYTTGAYNMEVKAVIARTVVDYLCTLNDFELDQLSSDARGISNNANFLETLR